MILLGANAPIDGIVRAAIEEDADAIVLGVYNGNALELGERLATARAAMGGAARSTWAASSTRTPATTCRSTPVPRSAGLGVHCVDTADELLHLLARG